MFQINESWFYGQNCTTAAVTVVLVSFTTSRQCVRARTIFVWASWYVLAQRLQILRLGNGCKIVCIFLLLHFCTLSSLLRAELSLFYIPLPKFREKECLTAKLYFVRFYPTPTGYRPNSSWNNTETAGTATCRQNKTARKLWLMVVSCCFKQKTNTSL